MSPSPVIGAMGLGVSDGGVVVLPNSRVYDGGSAGRSIPCDGQRDDGQQRSPDLRRKHDGHQRRGVAMAAAAPPLTMFRAAVAHSTRRARRGASVQARAIRRWGRARRRWARSTSWMAIGTALRLAHGQHGESRGAVGGRGSDPIPLAGRRLGGMAGRYNRHMPSPFDRLARHRALGIRNLLRELTLVSAGCGWHQPGQGATSIRQARCNAARSTIQGGKDRQTYTPYGCPARADRASCASSTA